MGPVGGEFLKRHAAHESILNHLWLVWSLFRCGPGTQPLAGHFLGQMLSLFIPSFPMCKMRSPDPFTKKFVVIQR